MKFDDHVKKSLSEAPQRGWRQELHQAVMREIHKNPSMQSRSERRQSTAQAWVAGFIGVCVMGYLAANELGIKPWHHLAAPQGGSFPVAAKPSDLRLYSGTILRPTGAAPLLPTLTAEEAFAASMLPVVRVSATYGVDTGTVTAPPTQVMTLVPSSLASRMAAYYVPLSRFDAFYLVGPKAMTGKLSVGADGSFVLTLKNQDAFIEMDGPGGSGISAAGIAAPFFANARTFLKTALPTGKQQPLANAAVKHVSPQLVEFAFKTQDQQQAAGFCFYQMVDGRLIGSFGQSTLFLYKTSQADADLGKWVMNTALSALTNIGEPQLSGQEMQSETATVNVSGRRVALYVPQGKAPFAVSAPGGIAWIQYPAYINHHQSLVGQTPAGPYNVQLSPIPTDATPLSRGGSSSRTLFSIPGYRVPDATNIPWYTFPTSLQLVSNRWLLYTLMYAGVGMNQPGDNEIRLYDMKSGKEAKMTSFRIGGGGFFAMGVYKDNVVYDQSGIADPKGDMIHDVVLENLATGKVTHLPSKSRVNDTIVTTITGKTVTIPLRTFP